MATRAKLTTVEQALDELPDTMRIWDAVCKTDPSHTKRVNQRGGFTAIDAQYQLMEATRQFGPVGEGWGYDVGEFQIVGPLIIVPVTLWHTKRDNRFGPILGCCEIAGQRPDRDAPKKAITDAITKGLSQLGFNADVFLGRFDDNKYVEERRRETAEPAANDGSEATGEPKPKQRVKLPDLKDGVPAPYPFITHLMTATHEFVRTLNSFADLEEFTEWGKSEEVQLYLKQLKRDLPGWWAGGHGAPDDWVPIDILISQKRRDLEQIESLKEPK
jgi:hypothetical protein